MSVFVDKLKAEFGDDSAYKDVVEMLTAILEIPDVIFDVSYASIKQELLKNKETDEFKELILELVKSPDREEVVNTFKEIVQSIEDTKEGIDLSENKIDCLITIFSLIVEGCEETMKKPYIPINIPIELCSENAKVPTYANVGDAGMDVYAIEGTTVFGGETKLVKTGLKVAIPFGYELQVRPRSGMSLKTGIRIANAPGTIDCGYRDEIGIIVHNTSPIPYEIKIGDRVAQLVLQKVPFAEFVIVDSVAEIGEDRKGGFGSSGK